MDKTTDSFWLLNGMILLLCVFSAVVYTVNVLVPFSKERRYIKGEMARSSGRERLAWKRSMKHLYGAYFPFLKICKGFRQNH